MAAVEPKYESVCKCGQVQVELRGDPIVTLVCFCNDCASTCKYCDDLASAAGTENISCFKNGEQGLYGTSFWLEHIKIVKGEDLLVSFTTQTAKTVRCYASCCKTCMICVGGKDFPYNGRGFNTNTLRVAKTGAPFVHNPIHRIMGFLAPNGEWIKVPGPKNWVISFSFLFTLLPKILFPWFFPGAGANKGRLTPGFFNDVKDVKEIIPISTYHSLGRKLDVNDDKKLA